jgi:UDP-N-acetylmuramoyl-tripeptide--D-alanyl-D-alanine ligase
MIEMTLAGIAAATGGTVADADPGLVVSGPVEYDSRRVAAGGLFAAFAGDRMDGHDFAGAAVAAGAAAVLATRPVGVPAVVVADPLAALAALARAVLARLPDLTVVGITGSSGKTSTKDLVAQLLAGLGPTVAAAGSLNNELGVPATVLRADEKTRFLVLEMGARGLGHLAELCAIARPDIAVVVNVGPAHVGEFGSLAATARAKSELVAAVRPPGVAVLNADDPRVRAMAPAQGVAAVLAGQAPDATVRAVDVPVRLGLPGAHQVGNSLLAAAVARACGLPLAELGTALSDLRTVSDRRMDVYDRADGVTVIDDSYNANPASTAAALQAQVAVGPGRRRVAVLGYHAELGEAERAGHEEVGRLAAGLGVDLLVVVGANAAPIGAGATAVQRWGGEAVLVDDEDQAVAVLRAALRPDDVVLVKGSRYRTWKIADWLRAHA